MSTFTNRMHSQEFTTPASQKDWDSGDYDRYRKEADDINTSARNLFETMKIFIINGKKRMLVEEQEVDEDFTTRSFNKLFNKINIEGTEAYFSGPRFFKVINKFDADHSDYLQYIEERRRKAQSTTRKVFFKDVLDALDDEIRDLVVREINQIADEEKIEVAGNETKIISVYTSKKESENTGTILEPTRDKQIIVKDNFIHIETPIVSFKIDSTSPKVFISYSWDDEEHKAWVLKLSNDLRAKGVETILDRYSLSPGSNASYFMEDSIESADKILIIFTENYKDRASSRTGGVGIEYSMLNREICDNIIDNEKYISILRKGSQQSSIPMFMRQYIALYMTDNTMYEEQLKELVHSIFNKPMVPMPKIGQVPDYIK